jgi:hypothetical protein
MTSQSRQPSDFVRALRTRVSSATLGVSTKVWNAFDGLVMAAKVHTNTVFNSTILHQIGPLDYPPVRDKRDTTRIGNGGHARNLNNARAFGRTTSG